MAARDELRSAGRNTIFGLLTFLIPFFGRGIRRRFLERQRAKEREALRVKALRESMVEYTEADRQRQENQRILFNQAMQTVQNEAAAVRGAGERRAEAARAAAAKRH